jgi:post-segregation antitoxin (ccd killing protein)
MPRLQVYLPDELYRALKAQALPASELLQNAVRAELRRRELLGETEKYLSELIEEVGDPSAAARARAESLSRRLQGGQAQSSQVS